MPKPWGAFATRSSRPAVTVDIVDVGRRLSARPIRAWSRRRSRPISHVIHKAFEACRSATRPSCGCEPPAGPVRRICRACWCASKKRRGSELYINDGAYGALFDARAYRLALPGAAAAREAARTRRAGRRSASMARPATIWTIWRALPRFRPTSAPGDYIEVGMLGAYGCAMRTGFNGFGSDETVVIVDDEPMASLYWCALRSGSRRVERRHAVEGAIEGMRIAGRRPWHPCPSAGASTRLFTLPHRQPSRRSSWTTPPSTTPARRSCCRSSVEHIDIKSFDARPIVDAMGKMSFTSRDLGRATEDLQPDAGRQGLLRRPGDRRLDLGRRLHGPLCRAGAQQHGRRDRRHRRHHRRHGFLRRARPQALSRRCEIPDDDTLRSLYIDRIYDTYIDEDGAPGRRPHHQQDRRDAAEPRPIRRAPSSARWASISSRTARRTTASVKLAYEHDVPIFCPAFTDSSAGFGLVKHQVDAMKAGKPYHDASTPSPTSAS